MPSEPATNPDPERGAISAPCDRCRLYRRLTLLMAAVVAGLWLIGQLAA